MAFFAAVATLFGTNVMLWIVFGIAAGTSQIGYVIFRTSCIWLAIKWVCWFGTAWAALSMFEAMGGM
ncbi:hypothetical protein PSC71_09050 [Devosia sp. J2-20]|uniref:hypothetical protein n=1 Tax=Devosia sp. J2-20 TaxID=3026161 RepID=UPI00249A667F|nr:hypothetical protein [Devosia sp. J2-20]WDR00865.1 hypothetical protein PSC71_09050 [Devosia sp. J2-20]